MSGIFNKLKDISGRIKEQYIKHKWLKPVSIAAGIVIVLAVVLLIIFNSLFGNLNRVVLDENDLGIEEVATRNVDEEKLTRITNIALFGIDTTEGAATIGDQYRSDSIIVLTIDPVENVFKITSILRDSKVPIEGHDPQKINAAYKYGGPQLAVKTINQNFKTNIKDYITVDFAEMAQIVDLVGGVEIEITEAEAKNMMENNIIEPVKAGKHLLDGPQAVAYARVRKVDSDYYRASRQQTVLQLVFDKIKEMKKEDYPSVIRSFLKCVQTSLSYNEFLTIARSMDIGTAKLVKNTIPDPEFEEGLWGGIDETGAWVWVYDLDAAADRIHEIIYGKKLSRTEEEKATTTVNTNIGSGSSEASGNVNNQENYNQHYSQQGISDYRPNVYEEAGSPSYSTDEYEYPEGYSYGDDLFDYEPYTQEMIPETTEVLQETEDIQNIEQQDQPINDTEQETAASVIPETQENIVPETTAAQIPETEAVPETEALQPETEAEPVIDSGSEPIIDPVSDSGSESERGQDVQQETEPVTPSDTDTGSDTGGGVEPVIDSGSSEGGSAVDTGNVSAEEIEQNQE